MASCQNIYSHMNHSMIRNGVFNKVNQPLLLYWKLHITAFNCWRVVVMLELSSLTSEKPSILCRETASSGEWRDIGPTTRIV